MTWPRYKAIAILALANAQTQKRCGTTITDGVCTKKNKLFSCPERCTKEEKGEKKKE